MNKYFLTAVFFIISANLLAQSKYEKGYIIDKNNLEISCYIKNLKWSENPKVIYYRLNLNEEDIKASVEDILGFGIEENIKYISTKVNVDLSSNSLNELTNERNPIYKEEELFLKVLIKGQANLYVFNGNNNTTIYFYKVNNKPIEQLIYKLFRSTNKNFQQEVKENNFFKQQLSNDLTCDKIIEKDYNSLKYNLISLKGIFEKYNQCLGISFEDLSDKKSFGNLHLNIRPGLTLNDYEVFNGAARGMSKQHIGYRLGLETEFNFNNNLNKWSLLFEPNFKTLSINDDKGVLPSGNAFTTVLDMNMFEVPLGIRYYFFNHNQSSIFFNASLNFNYLFNSNTKIIHYDNLVATNISENRTFYNFVFGAGYTFNKKYFFEARYQPTKSIYPLTFFYGGLTTYELIVGYRLF